MGKKKEKKHHQEVVEAEEVSVVLHAVAGKPLHSPVEP